MKEEPAAGAEAFFAKPAPAEEHRAAQAQAAWGHRTPNGRLDIRPVAVKAQGGSSPCQCVIAGAWPPPQHFRW